MPRFLLVALFLALVAPTLVFAGLGVGVGTGKMVVDEPLQPGTIYDLPALAVINTGDIPAAYSVGVSGRESQPELLPKEEWFSFSPTEFDLEPGASQMVQVTLQLPLKVQPGDYFAFVKGFPVPKGEGGASIGLAAAAKLYFTVSPANIFVGLYYRALTLWQRYLPWSNIIAAVILGFFLLRFLRSRFSFSVTKKSSPAKSDPDE